MEPIRATSIQDLSQQLDTVRCLRVQLQACEAVYEKTLLRLESEETVSDILQSVEASESRSALNAALENLERVRHCSRLSMIAAEIEEGSSISDVGRDWGFSRQMAQRYVKEARTGSWTMSHRMVSQDG
jgi:hypothetical protein